MEFMPIAEFDAATENCVAVLHTTRGWQLAVFNDGEWVQMLSGDYYGLPVKGDIIGYQPVGIMSYGG